MSTQGEKPVVVGIYGIPGCGKSTMLGQLQELLEADRFLFFEGSDVINDLVVEGGLEAFKKMGKVEKERYREQAIDQIATKSANDGKTGVVTGHFMFCNEEEGTDERVWTINDQNVYTHILYLDIDAKTVIHQQQHDTQRSRSSVSPVHLAMWQETEKKDLRKIGRQNGILFSLIKDVEKAEILLRDFDQHTEVSNVKAAQETLDQIVKTEQHKPETMLVFDGDKTLAAEDTGAMFWSRISGREKDLDTLFSSNLGYSHGAFRQAMLMYEEVADDAAFDSHCAAVASQVTMYPELAKLIVLATSQNHVGAVIITSGLSSVWKKVLHKYGLAETVGVIGGGRITDGYVFTAQVKRDLVMQLQNTHNMHVWAFGDSPLDLDMLKRADEAIVVVGDENSRSKSMERALKDAIQQDGLSARQLLLPKTAVPRLDTNILPQIDPGHITVEALLRRRFKILHATDKPAAKLLMAPMRDASNAGHLLRESHRHAGWYLGTEYVSRVLGLEEYQIPHVQGRPTSGHRLDQENRTATVALMRGGEPMAFGLSEAFPLAMFIHAKDATDIKPHHLSEVSTVLLVDSVVNSGKSVVDFVHHIRGLKDVRIVIVAGVVQAQAISRNGSLIKSLKGYNDLSLVALRLSESKFTGSGGTDTGNRLFNTTHLD